MNFKNWLLNELTVPDLSAYDWIVKSRLSAADLLNFQKNYPFIYVAKTGKIFIGNKIGQYHHNLLADLMYSDRDNYIDAHGVKVDSAPGAVGRIGWSNAGKYYDHPLPKEKIVAFYEQYDNFKVDSAKNAVQVLLSLGDIEQSSIVKLGDKLMLAAASSGQEIVKEKNNQRLNFSDPKQVESLRMAYKSGRWPDGRDLSAPEKEFIGKQLALIDGRLMGKNPWQAAMEKEKLISPGTNFRTPYSDSTIY